MKVNRVIEAEFFFGASPEIFRRASELRKNMTKAEIILWQHLRMKRVNGLTFRRQHPISNFIADFYCHKIRLVIEVDGEIHNNVEIIERDKGRDYFMNKLGLNVIRFTNSEIINNPDEVIDKIKLHCSQAFR